MAQQRAVSGQEELSQGEFEEASAKASEKARTELKVEREKSGQARVETALRRAGIPKRFKNKTFGSYNPEGAGQARIRDICQRYATGFKRVYEGGVNLVLTGRPGTGKTHLAVAILQEVMTQGKTGIFVSVSEMLRAIRATYSANAEIREDQAFDSFIKPHLLVLDEVGVSIGDEEKRKAMVFDVINARYNAMKPTILLGNLNEEDLKQYLGERVWDRIREGGAPVLAFTWESYRGKGSQFG